MKNLISYLAAKLAVCFALFTMVSQLSAASIVWTNTAGGPWNVPINWSPNQVPGGGDTAEITNSGVYAVTLNASTTVGGLKLGATNATGMQTLVMNGFNLTLQNPGTIQGQGVLELVNGTLTGSLTVEGVVKWSGGLIKGGNLKIASGGLLRFIGGADKSLNQLVINNFGTMDWIDAGRIVSYYDWSYQTVAITNEASGLFYIGSDSSMVISNPSGHGANTTIFHNAGLLRKADSTGTNSFVSAIGIVHTGTMDVQSGTLEFPGGLTSSGTFQTAKGAAVQFTGGSLTLKEGHQTTGEGYFGVPKGTVSINGANPGTLYWTGGMLSAGKLVIPTNGILNIQGGTAKLLNKFTLDNHGVIHWNGAGSLVSYYDWAYQTVAITNDAGGLFSIETDAKLEVSNPSVHGGNSTFIHNAGTLLKSDFSGTNWFDSRITVVNAGRVELSRGTLEFPAGLTSSGTFQTAKDAAVQFTGGTLTLKEGHQTSGEGYFGVPGGTVSISGTNSGTLYWTGGMLSAGRLVIPTNSIFNIQGDTAKSLNKFTLDNYGVIHWNGTGSLVSYYDWAYQTVAITNYAGAIFSIETDAKLEVSNPSGHGANSTFIHNAGTLIKSDFSGTNWFDSRITVVNAGLVELSRGAFEFPGGLTSSGEFLGADGTRVQITGGTLSLQDGHKVSGGDFFFGVPSGTVTLSGANPGPFSWTGGTLTDGTLIIPTNGVLRVLGAEEKLLNSFTIINQGRIDWLGSGPIIGYYDWAYQTVAITNVAGGVMNMGMGSDSSLGFRNPSGYGSNRLILHNAGTLSNNTGTGMMVFDPRLTLINEGQFQINQGSVRINNGFANYGSIVLATNTVAHLAGGSFGFNTNSLIQGDGKLVVSKGDVTINGPVAHMEWTGGRLVDSAITVISNAVLTIAGDADKTILRSTINNAGVIDWSGTGRLVGYFDWANQKNYLINLAGGVFNVENDSAIIFSNPSMHGGNVLILHNAGILRKKAGTGITKLDPQLTFINEGLLQLDQGTIEINRGLTNDGDILLATNTVAHLARGTFNFSTNTVIQGDGKMTVSEGDVTINGLVDKLEWSGGRFVDSAILVASNAVMTITGAADKTILRSTLNNAGIIQWSGTGPLAGYFDWANQGNYLTNLAGGVFQVDNDSALIFSNPSGYGGNYFGFHNAGLFRKTSGTNALTIDSRITFINQGELDVETGMVRFQGSPTLTAQGTLAIGIAGITPGVEHGKIIFDNAATLAGTVSAHLNNGFKPDIGQVITNLSAKSYTGSFLNTNITAVGAHRYFSVNYMGPNVVLRTGSAPSPMLDSITLDENTPIEIAPLANDFDEDGETITLASFTQPAHGVVARSTGNRLLYSPQANYFGTDRFTYIVTDASGFSETGTVDLTIRPMNQPPVLAAITNLFIGEGVLLTFTNSATYAEPSRLVYSLLAAPNGAAINPTNGIFSWIPNEAQGPGVYNFGVMVADNGSPNMSATQAVNVTVAEINLAPVLSTPPDQSINPLVLFSLKLAANDPDLPTNKLTFKLVASPSGMVINPDNGLISWTPTAAQAASTNTVTAQVTDNGVPALSDTKSFLVVVQKDTSNKAPVLALVPDQIIDEQTTLMVTNSATDADLPPQSLTFGLVSGPNGLTINPANGVIQWTPTEAQGPGTNVVTVRVSDSGTPSLSATNSFTVRVREVNRAPQLVEISNVTCPVQTQLTIPVIATDADIPTNTLVFTLVQAPSGMAINKDSGTMTWTPASAQAPSTNTVTVKVTDNGVPPLSDTKSYQIVVQKDTSNQAPVLALVPDQIIDEQTTLMVTNTATDADLPAQTLTFGLVAGPNGLTINPANGVIQWTPTEAQGPGTNVVTVRVSDNGAPSMSATNSFTVRVREVNAAPVLLAIATQTVKAQTALSVTAIATDVDIPANTFSFSLVQAPGGMTINRDTGLITWTPAAPGTNSVTVKVTDNGAPALSDTKSFLVIVTGGDVTPPAVSYTMEPGPDMVLARMGHMIAELGSGQVVVYGGHGKGFTALNSLEIWNPQTNTFVKFNLPQPFDGGAMVKLSDNQYLLAGSAADWGVAPGYKSACLVNPVTGSSVATTGSMVHARVTCTGAKLANGKALIAGGWYDNNSATYGEVYDPATQTFIATGPLNTPRSLPLVLPTTDGKAVVVGGRGVFGTPTLFDQVELYDPTDNKFTVLASSLFAGETGWGLNYSGDRPIESFKLTDGRFAFMAYRSGSTNTEYVLAFFDPGTKQFTKLPLNPALADTANMYWVVDPANNAMVYLAGKNTNNQANTIFQVHRANLATGERVAVSDTLSITNYYLGSPALQLLKDGRIMVTGGSSSVDSSYNFNPVNHVFFLKPTTPVPAIPNVVLKKGPDMVVARMAHTITELADGQIAVLGGHGQGFVALNSLELWNPQSNIFTKLDLPQPFDGGALVKLNNTQYLLAGGSEDLGIAPGYNTACIFDASARTATATTGAMTRARTTCSGTKLTNGKVLIVGAWYDNNSATYGEVYDPATQTFSASGALNTPRAWPVVLPADDGKAVVAGGMGVYGSPTFFEQTEVYDPAENKFTQLSSSLFAGESGWVLPPLSDRLLEDVKMKDGRYAFLAYRTGASNTVEYVAAFFNPATKQFTKMAMNPPWNENLNLYYVLDRERNALIFMAGKNINGQANTTFTVHSLNLATGEHTKISESITIADYYLGAPAIIRLKDGRIFVTGGSTSVDFNYNFTPVKSTFFLEPRQPTVLKTLFNNGNIDLVFNTPTAPTTFTLDQPAFITKVQNYHYNNEGHLPGTIGLRHNDGTLYGPWSTYGIVGQGGVPNASWVAEPWISLKAGTYTVEDSDPATWSQNSGSGGAGFTIVEGYLTTALPPIPYIQWASGKGLTQQNWDRNADPDQDGINNFLEYALGGNPLAKENRASYVRPVAFLANGHLAMFYRQRAGGTGMAGVDYEANGIKYVVEISPDLKPGNWVAGSFDTIEYIGNSRIDNGDGTETLAVQLRDAITPKSKRFMRLRVIDTFIPR